MAPLEAGSGAGVWIELERLLALPLPAEALASLWRELLRGLPEGSSEERAALEAALETYELGRIEALCFSGSTEIGGIGESGIEEGLSRLEGLAAALEPARLAELLGRLLPELHRRLVESAGPDPAPEVVADPQRAEGLWQADRWMRRLEALPHEESALRSMIAEQLCRYGAIAWLAQPGVVARRRAVLLLQRLLLLLPEARSWVVPAIRDRLLLALEDLGRGGELVDPSHLAELFDVCAAMAADPGLSDEARAALQLAVFRGRATLEVWGSLKEN
jgi:hypothetical protein